jgi:hypothetical protein
MTRAAAEAELSLARTPEALRALMELRPLDWLEARHEPDVMSPIEAMAHFLQGEDVDWLFRIRFILEHGDTEPFPPFDMAGWKPYMAPLNNMLHTFDEKRVENLKLLDELGLTTDDCRKQGLHPGIGPVTVEQVICTWAAHDIYHMGMICKSFSSKLKPHIGRFNEKLNLPHMN